jgi:hypothetical protein
LCEVSFDTPTGRDNEEFQSSLLSPQPIHHNTERTITMKVKTTVKAGFEGAEKALLVRLRAR